MAHQDLQISINDAVSMLESAIEIVLDLQGSLGIDPADRSLVPHEVTEAASVALRNFFQFDFTQ